MASLARRLTAEGLGTALLLAVVIGSGIMGERLSDGNDGVVRFHDSSFDTPAARAAQDDALLS